MAQQVQVLPYVPSPLEQLTPHLAQFGANIGEGLVRRQARTLADQVLNGNPTTSGSPNTSSPNNGIDTAGLLNKAQIIRQGYGEKFADDYVKSELAKSTAAEKQNQRDQSEIAKENRKEISNFAESYKDPVVLKTNLNKLEEARKIIRTGKVSFDENMFRNAISGILEGKESPLSEGFKTPEQQKLWYLLRDSLKPKDIGGSNPSTREVLIAMSSLPGGLKGRAANEYIIDAMINQAKGNLKTSESISGLRKKNPTATFSEFQEALNSELSPYMESLFQDSSKKSQGLSQIEGKKLPKGSVWMVSPDGTVGSVPVGQVDAAKQEKFTLLE